MPTISGTFDVTLTPAPLANPEADKTLARLALTKTFHGPLQATSRGEMLSATTPTQGSAGYVAIERVAGTLDGRTGSFVLLHAGLMARGTPTLSVTIVPDSATDALLGLASTMTLTPTHTYSLTYTLPNS